MRLIRIWLAALIALTGAASLLGGCGEKIAIPQPEGLYSASAYLVWDRFDDPSGPLQLTVANGALFVVSPDSLVKRDQSYGLVAGVGGLDDARSVCVDGSRDYVFVYEKGPRQVSWYSTRDLEHLGTSPVPDVQEAVAMATNPVGIEQVPGALTYLYLSDTDSLVIHRYAFDEFAGLVPHGILARSDGSAARFVHIPAGLATDSQDSLLVCDADTNRNWVIRFDGFPDLTDVTPDPDDQDPWRGTAALFDNASGCPTAAAADFTLGDAAECGETGWTGGPSESPGEFHAPRGLAIDGDGRIYVADTGNSRIQIFDASGDYDLLFGNPEDTPAPISLGTVDVVSDPANNVINFGAFVFVLLEGQGQVVKYISADHYNDINTGEPPPE
jgi:hypothetical protein